MAFSFVAIEFVVEPDDLLCQRCPRNLRSLPESLSNVRRKVPSCSCPHCIDPSAIYRFPHPVTLSGMLEMSRMFLPINSNWSRFIHEADRTYESIDSDIQHVLMQIANEACHQANEQK